MVALRRPASLEYLGTSPEPTYFGVFCVQMAAMPGTTGLLFRETTATPSVQGIVNGLFSSLPPLPSEALHVRDPHGPERPDPTVAEFERVAQRGDPPDTTSWRPFVDEVEVPAAYSGACGLTGTGVSVA